MAAWQKSLPWIKPHYAIKSNPYEEVVQDFLEKGSGVDCASRNEIELSLKLGASKDDIVYSNPIKNETDLIWAEENGIKLTTADSIDELEKIQKYAHRIITGVRVIVVKLYACPYFDSQTICYK